MCEQTEAADFCRRLDQTHREPTCRMVRKRFPSLTAADVEDVWSQTQAALIAKRSSDKASVEGPRVGGLVRQIALCRACDLLREHTKESALVEVQGQAIEAKLAAESNGSTAWWEHLDPELKQELRLFVSEAFRLLSPDEWLVLSTYCEYYPDLKTPNRLLRSLVERSPQIAHRNWNSRQVRRLLDQARSVVQDYLRSKGYDLDFEE